MSCTVKIVIKDKYNEIIYGEGVSILSDTDVYRIIKDLKNVINIKDINGNSGRNFTIPD